MADILLLAAHPDLIQSSVTQSLLDAVGAARLPQVSVVDLYRRYPDYAIDVEAEQQALSQAKLLVLLHPLHWYGMPALQKLWLDEVLRFGWAYGPEGTALNGKDFWLVTSTGGTAASYSAEGHNRHPLSTYLLPYEQTALHCGMRYLPPLVLHGAHQLDDQALMAHARQFVERLSRYPEGLDVASTERLEVPLDERPALFSTISR